MMLRPSAAPTPPPLQHSALPLTNGKTAYNPSQKLRWLVVAVALLVVATLALRVPREPGAAKALGCHVSSAAGFRAAPGAALRDDGGCVAPTALDAGVCVEARGRVGRRCVPSLAVIGAMKSGTTTLQVQLAAQTGVFMTTPKEPNFFSDDDVFAKGAGWYKGLFADAAPGDLKGEASTHYTKLPTYPDCLPRLAQMLDAPRLIYVIRELRVSF